MKCIKNDKGYTVLIVLLTIVVIGLLAPPLINSVMSSSLQYQKTEENVQLENLVDMGKQYFRNEVEGIANSKTETNNSVDKLKTELTHINNAERTYLSNEKDTLDYRVGYEKIEMSENGYIVINYASIATVDGVELKEVEQYLLKYTGNNVDDNSGEDGDSGNNTGNNRSCLDLSKKNNGTIHLAGKKYCTISGDLTISENIKITGNATLEVLGDEVEFTGDVFVAGNGTIFIEKMQQFKSTTTEKGNGIIIAENSESTQNENSSDKIKEKKEKKEKKNNKP